MNKRAMPNVVHALPLMGLWTGLAALENQFVAPDLPPELKRVNLGIGGLTGYLLRSKDPKVQTAALAGIPLKQLALYATGTADKLRSQQQSLVDANLGVARINRDTARLNQSNASGAQRLALAFLLPALVAGGGLGYLGYSQWKKRNPKVPKYKTVAEKGKSRSGQKIRIDVPATALPSSFFSALTNVDDTPRARTRILELEDAKAASANEFSIPGLLKDIAWETTSVPGFQRLFSDAGAAAGAYSADSFPDAARYGAGALGNLMLLRLGLNTATYPLLGQMLGEQFLRHQGWGMEGVKKRRFMGPLARQIHRWSFGERYGPEVARGVYDPARFAWQNPTTSSKLFRGLLTAPNKPVTTWPGTLANLGRYGGNRAWNLAYRGLQASRRHPVISALAMGIPLSSMGRQRDQSQAEEAARSVAQWMPDWKQQKGPMGMPISATLASVMGSLGMGDPRNQIQSQLQL